MKAYALVFGALSCLAAACSSSAGGPSATRDAGGGTGDAHADVMVPRADAATPDADALAPPPDAAPEAAPNDAAPYPAFKPDMPRIVNSGGALLTRPQIVTVTWSGDPNTAAFEAFGDVLGGSAYWHTTLGPYGIGAATSGAARHVRITSAIPGNLSASQLDTMIADDVSSAPTSGWPADDNQTEYVVYVPQTTRFTDGGQNACNLEEGYHDETSEGSLPHIVYAVVIEGCHAQENVVDFSTETASHEIAEAATDPHAESDLAWAYFDSKHLAWDLWQGDQDEVGDACEYFDDAFYQDTGVKAWVQRLWSNTSGLTGHNPCLPLPARPYFNATPLGLGTVTVTTDNTGTQYTSEGYRIGVGQQKTLRFGLYSDAPLAPWTVGAVEGDDFSTPNRPRLSISLGSTSGSNGDVVDVNVKVNSVGAATGILMTVTSTSGQLTHYMPVLIGAY